MSSPPVTYSSSHRGSPYNNRSTQPPPPPPRPRSQIAITDVSADYSVGNQPVSSSQSQQSPPLDQNSQDVSTIYNQGRNHNPSSDVLHSVQSEELRDEVWFPKVLEDKSKQQLAEILENPKLLNALLYSTSTAHPSLVVNQKALQAALSENIALASHLKEVEARLLQLRLSSQAQLLSTHALERQWRQKQTEMDRALAPFTPPSLYQNLVQAIQEQEHCCAELEAEFLDGDGIATEKDVIEWIKRFREARKVYYSRQARKERWDEGRIGGWR
ncbi:putative endosomal sorting complex assembly [Golovinomyces cichoracearum]|uniref:Putative endosomal sorting complex assembly n=1 Tax=Golovinomyces cichoracearum TaxID=62708 RepID=A0A420J7V2_9PEZI|nr:putative endosomal sorting complex assembly [Golovinomyces cichoracearum]